MTLTEATQHFVRAHRLTPRQGEIAERIFDGDSPVDVAQKMGLSVDTVRNHMKGIYTRTKVGSASQLLALFVKLVLELA